MTLNIERIQALCFDVDGTLRDTDDRYAAQIAGLLAPFSRLLPGRDAKRAARWLVMRLESPGNFIFGLPDTLGVDDELVSISDWLHDRGWLKTKAHDYLVVPGAASALLALREQFPMSVISARPKRGTHAFLEGSQLLPLFKFIASGQSAPRTKPHPNPVFLAAEMMGVKADACLMIGDTTVDILAGKRAGAQTAGVLSGFGEEQELRDAGADMILESVAALPALFGITPHLPSDH